VQESITFEKSLWGISAENNFLPNENRAPLDSDKMTLILAVSNGQDGFKIINTKVKYLRQGEDPVISLLQHMRQFPI
jgi:hypothetical protein